MATFKYTAKDINSKKFKGMLEANSRDEVVALLRLEDLYLLKCQEVIVEKSRKRMKNAELSEFCRELGAMISSGVSLIMAMNILAKRATDKRLQNVYKDIYVKLQQGMSFSDSLASCYGVFPSLMVNMFRASESTGRMDVTASKLAIQFNKDAKLQNKVKSAMTYPVALIVVTLLVVIGIFTIILPNFFDLFGDMDTPMITQIMFAISRGLTAYWYWILIFILCFVCAIIMALRTTKVRYTWDKAKTRIPYVGRLTKIIYTARFARSMSSLYSSGVSMINSLSLAKSTVNNAYIESQFDQVISQVRDGTSLSQALSIVDGFDVKLASSIYIGEESGQLDDMLTNVADDFEYEAEMATERLVTLLQPVMIIVLGVVIGTVVISVILPMYSLYGSVGAG